MNFRLAINEVIKNNVHEKNPSRSLLRALEKYIALQVSRETQLSLGICAVFFFEKYLKAFRKILIFFFSFASFLDFFILSLLLQYHFSLELVFGYRLFSINADHSSLFAFIPC